MNNYNNAFSEASIILQHLEFKELKKIPKEIINTIEENKNPNYCYKIDKTRELKEQIILPETKAILANIYRDYIATNEKKEIIRNNEKKEILEIEKKKTENYNNQVLFKNKKTNNELMIVNKKETLFTKIKNKIVDIIRMIKEKH